MNEAIEAVTDQAFYRCVDGGRMHTGPFLR